MANIEITDGSSKWELIDVRKGNINNTNDTPMAYTLATQTNDGLMSKDDKNKLDNIENNATKNIEGRNITIGTDGSINVVTLSGSAKYLREDGNWEVPIDTTYTLATQTTDGLMSSSDKVKLDNINTSLYATKDEINGLSSIYAQKTDLEAYAQLSDISTISGGDINVIEHVAVNGTDLSIDDNKRVNIDLSGYTTVSGGEANRINYISANNTDLLIDSNKRVNIPLVNQTDDGLMSKEDKIKLDSIDTSTYATKDEINGLSSIYAKLSDISTISSGDINVIEHVAVNGTDLLIDSNKRVNIPLDDITEDLNKEISKLKNQIQQTDINLNNLYIQMNADRELGLETNLLLIEDFKNLNYLDTYSTNVINVSEINGKVLTVNNISGLYVNREYFITDGINSETVVVSSIKRSGTTNTITLKDNLSNTYDTNRTILNKTTMTILNKRAFIDTSSKDHIIPFDTIWRGISSDSSTTIPLNTSQSNSSQFDITGSGAFNSNGEFTLA